MTDREKLIELIHESIRYAGDVCGETGNCGKCQYDKYGSNCGLAIRADYLLDHGVTFAKDINVPTHNVGDNEIDFDYEGED